MNKPSSGLLIFLAGIGALAGAAAVRIASHERSSSYSLLIASFATGAGVILSLYFYAPYRWRSVAGLGDLKSITSGVSTNIGHASAAGAVGGPLAVAAISLASGWSKGAIVACLSAWLSGFVVALVSLWVILFRIKRMQASAE